MSLIRRTSFVSIIVRVRSAGPSIIYCNRVYSSAAELLSKSSSKFMTISVRALGVPSVLFSELALVVSILIRSCAASVTCSQLFLSPMLFI